MIDLVSAVLTVAPVVIYAVAGAVDAYKSGEKINVLKFVKTIAISAISVGLISQKTSDIVVELAGTSAVSIAIDKLINALTKKKENL